MPAIAITTHARIDGQPPLPVPESRQPSIPSHRAVHQKDDDSGSSFDCKICLDLARDPVLTCCGHLFCWPCLYRWWSHAKECPVCKGEVTAENVTPVYGGQADSSGSGSGSGIPPRPRARRLPSSRSRQTAMIQRTATPVPSPWETIQRRIRRSAIERAAACRRQAIERAARREESEWLAAARPAPAPAPVRRGPATRALLDYAYMKVLSDFERNQLQQRSPSPGYDAMEIDDAVL